MRNWFDYIGSIIDQKMPHNPTILAAVYKGRSSPLNDMVHFRSFRQGKNWQGDNLTQFCIVSKGKCFIVVQPSTEMKKTKQKKKDEPRLIGLKPVFSDR